MKNNHILTFMLLFFGVSLAQTTSIILYNGSGNETPLMESSDRTFPEPPEYYANWGNLDSLIAPYIRLSGQINQTKDWTGSFTFSKLPAKILSGSLQMQVRATNNAAISIWLDTEEGNSDIKTYSLLANRTTNLSFDITKQATVRKIHVRLNQVLANQYTTIFFDNIILNNSENSGLSSSSSASSSSGIPIILPDSSKIFNDYLISADTVIISDQTKTLGGDIYGDVLEIGADTKIYGNVAANSKCFLRERANISGSMSFPLYCTKQNSITIGKEIRSKTKFTHSLLQSISSGSFDKSVAIGAKETLLPGAYGKLHIDARSSVTLNSGSYVFSNIHTEPDVKWHFDLSGGPVKIYVVNNIRFADRNTFTISNGNPSEIEWYINGNSVDIGTDGKYFGKFIAPNSYVRLAPRSHVVGSIEARRFLMEPQATVSIEPKAEEISHSEYNFGPFFNKNIYRYNSALPLSAKDIEMYVYAQGFDIKVNGNESRNVSIDNSSQTVFVKLTRSLISSSPFISDFPLEALTSTYNFTFNKTNSNRIYWNPNSPCTSNCYGTSEESALRSFSQALLEAQKNGLEVKMTGGSYEIPKEYSVFPVGLEIVGTEKSFWELNSFAEIPVLNVKNAPIEFKGISPRRLTGLHITGGTNGALKSATEKLELFGIAFTNNESGTNGGAIDYIGKGLFIAKTLLLENSKGARGGAGFIDGNAEITDLVCANNSATNEGGCLSVLGSLKLANAVFYGNKSTKAGGALNANSATVHNATVANNVSNGGNAFNGASGKVYNSVFWNNSGGNMPSSWAAQYSSFPNSIAGTGNVIGDPKFIDEKNAAGSSHFFGYDAGLILADKSPALKGSKLEGTLEIDLIGTERGNDIAMGAYANYIEEGEFQYVTWDFGNLKKAGIQRPLFASLPEQKVIEHFGYGGYGRIITRLVRKHDKTKISKAVIRFTLLDSTAKAYPDNKPIDIPFFRYGEKDGKYLFSTLTHAVTNGYDPEKHGRIVLFSKDPNDQGVHGNIIVIHVKDISDRFRYEVVEW